MRKNLYLQNIIGGVCVAMAMTMAPTVGYAKDKIKIGFIGPLSGGTAQTGLGARNGFILAIDQANEQGDYPYDVEAVVLDDASDPQTGASAALQLVNDPDVIAATGHWNSPVALATIPIFHRYEMPFIIWGATSPDITKQNLPEVTRVYPTLAAENQPLASWAAAADGLNAKKIAIISDTTDYGKSNSTYFDQYFTADGGAILSKDHAPVGTTDYRAILTRLKGQSPDAIYFGGVITEAGILRKQMLELGLDIPMIGISGIYDPEFIKIAGNAANGTYAGFPTDASSPKLDKLNKDYEAHNFAEPASPNTRHAYDAAGILLQVIKENGIADKVKLAEAVRAISYDGALGLTSFDEEGQTKVPVELQIMQVKDGKWVVQSN